jgi:hypothetical protein
MQFLERSVSMDYGIGGARLKKRGKANGASQIQLMWEGEIMTAPGQIQRFFLSGRRALLNIAILLHT